MYTYKCYFHPKEASAQPCRGCKLPICSGCAQAEMAHEGVCPDCIRKRTSVQQLRQMRAAMAAAPQTASTTARLRLVRRQMAEGRSGALPPVRSATTQLNTVPLPEPRGGSSALVPPRKPQAQPPQRSPQERRYNGDKVAYKPVAPKGDRFVHPAGPKQMRGPHKLSAPPKSKQSPWLMPFMVGIGVGVVLVVAATLAQPFIKPAGINKSRPAFSRLTDHEKATIDRVLKTQVVDALADIEAAPAPVRQTVAYTPDVPQARRVSRSAVRASAVRQAPTKRKPTLEEAMFCSDSPTATPR